MPSIPFRNFAASSRKADIIPFGLIQRESDTSWIDHNADPDNVVNVAYASSLVFEATTALIQRVVLSGNVTSSAIQYFGATSAQNGAHLIIQIVQDGAGNRTFSLPPTLRTDPDFSIEPTANWCTVLDIRYNQGAWEFSAPPVRFQVS